MNGEQQSQELVTGRLATVDDRREQQFLLEFSTSGKPQSLLTLTPKYIYSTLRTDLTMSYDTGSADLYYVYGKGKLIAILSSPAEAVQLADENVGGVENGVDTSPALLPKKEMRIIGIYSPVGRTQKTSFALTMGQILAKERAVLYLNMESYSGFERLLECSYDRGMSDILYYARQENQGIIYKLGGMVQSMQNLDYLPPAASPMDIQTAKYEEWKWLFQEIEKNSSYEVLILDLGDGVADLYQILDFCNEIYVPIRNDVISAAKMEQFENLLRRWDCQSVLDKMRKIHVPFHTANRTGKAYFEELVWSELGDYVRQILRDGRRGEET